MHLVLQGTQEGGLCDVDLGICAMVMWTHLCWFILCVSLTGFRSMGKLVHMISGFIHKMYGNQPWNEWAPSTCLGSPREQNQREGRLFTFLLLPAPISSEVFFSSQVQPQPSDPASLELQELMQWLPGSPDPWSQIESYIFDLPSSEILDLNLAMLLAPHSLFSTDDLRIDP